MKIIITALLLLNSCFAQDHVTILRFNCGDTLEYITNQTKTGCCGFYFENENPNLFVKENFTVENFYELVYEFNPKQIARAKLVMPGQYVAKAHDLVYTYTRGFKLQFYYFLKDSAEVESVPPRASCIVCKR